MHLKKERYTVTLGHCVWIFDRLRGGGKPELPPPPLDKRDQSSPLSNSFKAREKGAQHSTDEWIHYDIVSCPNCCAFLYKYIRSRRLFLLVLWREVSAMFERFYTVNFGVHRSLYGIYIYSC
jgi:hypothetical protein